VTAIATTKWWRELRPEEAGLHLDVYVDKLDTAVARMHGTLRTVLADVHESVVAAALQVSDRRRWDQLRGIVLADKMGEYRRAIKGHLNDIYQFTKAKAAVEYGIRAPVTSGEFVAWMESKSQLLAGLHATVLETRVRNAVMSAPTQGLMQARVSDVFDSFSDYELPKGMELAATLSVQAGRDDVHADLPDIERFTYSAILDQRVCPVCRKLDGVTWWATDPTIIHPPLHFWCRCILVGTLADALYKPEVTGLPPDFQLPEAHRRFVESLGAYHATS
jgi:uncharacterized protein with gpF-like domain